MRVIEHLNSRFVLRSVMLIFCFTFHDSNHQAPSSEVRMFQDLELNGDSGRRHVPSQAGNASTITSNSINLRKQLLLVMRQLSDDIESVRKSILRTCFAYNL